MEVEVDVDVGVEVEVEVGFYCVFGVQEVEMEVRCFFLNLYINKIGNS